MVIFQPRANMSQVYAKLTFFDALQLPDSVEGRYPISAAGGEGAAAPQDSNHESIWRDLTTNVRIVISSAQNVAPYLLL